MKRFILAALALIMVVGLQPKAAQAQGPSPGSDLGNVCS